MRGLGLGLASIVASIVASGLVIAACVKTPAPPLPPDWQLRQAKLNEVTALWTQIREWRREAEMELEPSPQSLLAWRGRTVREAKKNICPESHAVPKTCTDICVLAGHICDNAESICILADELGKDDDFAQEKCASAKASCREAKQRCCDKCSGPPPSMPASTEPAPGAPLPAAAVPPGGTP